jgi:aspartate ammonia-lyase
MPKLGYTRASKLIKESVHNNRSFLDIACERGLINSDEIFDLIEMAVRVD